MFNTHKKKTTYDTANTLVIFLKKKINRRKQTVGVLFSKTVEYFFNKAFLQK